VWLAELPDEISALQPVDDVSEVLQELPDDVVTDVDDPVVCAVPSVTAWESVCAVPSVVA
jgi:hypothetical protein